MQHWALYINFIFFWLESSNSLQFPARILANLLSTITSETFILEFTPHGVEAKKYSVSRNRLNNPSKYQSPALTH